MKLAPAHRRRDLRARVYLDLVGRIPTVAEARTFLEDKSSDKRAKLIDKLLASGGHTRHAATFWRRIWIPQADTPQFARLTDDFEEWLAAQLAENKSYDAIVKQMLVAPAPGRPMRGRPRRDNSAAQPSLPQASRNRKKGGGGEKKKKKKKKKTWRRTPLARSSVSTSIARSATIIRLRNGRATSFGKPPRSSRVRFRRPAKNRFGSNWRFPAPRRP